MQRELDVAIEVAKKAGGIMRKYFYANQQVYNKAYRSPVTIADTLINSMVIEHLSQEFPEDGVVGEEESTSEYGMGRKWICDPIDGTKAFILHIPTATFSLALVVDGVPTVGVVYEPMLDQMYTAMRGCGAYRNGEQIFVNSNTLNQGTLATTGSHFRIRNRAPFLDVLLDRFVPMSVPGGAALACVKVAEGGYAGFIEELMNLHDVAAGHVIVIESGGKVTDPYGVPLDYTAGPHKGALVSNGVMHDELVAIICDKGTGWDRDEPNLTTTLQKN